MKQPDLFGVAPATVDIAKSSPVADEMRRREGNYQRVLDRLRQGPATNHDLERVAGYRFGARLNELRRDGIAWDKAHVEGGTWRYFLLESDRRSA